MRKTLGIIGFGKFGQITAKHLTKYFRVFVSDCIDKRKEAGRIGVNFASLEECATKDVVLLCVAISDFEDVLKQIVPFLKDGALVIDVCSVKEKPVKIMEKLVPKECECIGMHPLFGPDTIKSGLKGKKIVLCPIRTEKLVHVKRFLSELGLSVIVSTPKEHDKQMAKSLALIHLLGRGLCRVGVNQVEMATPTHKMFIELVNFVRNDSEQLFIDMQIYNRYARKTRKALLQELIKIDGELDGKV